MSRYIDADKTELELWDHGVNMGGEYQGVWVRFRDIEEVFKNVPTADVVPVVHGHWALQENNNHVEPDGVCSNCGATWVFSDTYYFNYCPHCGSLMDEVTE